MHTNNFAFFFALFWLLPTLTSSGKTSRTIYIYILTIIYRYLYALTDFVFTIGIYSDFVGSTPHCAREEKGEEEVEMHELVVVNVVIALVIFFNVSCQRLHHYLHYSNYIALYKMVSVLTVFYTIVAL